MKTLTVQEAQTQFIVMTDGERKVTLTDGAVLNLEEDNPELECELLKAIDGPYTSYSTEEMCNIVERVIREEKRK